MNGGGDSSRPKLKGVHKHPVGMLPFKMGGFHSWGPELLVMPQIITREHLPAADYQSIFNINAQSKLFVHMSKISVGLGDKKITQLNIWELISIFKEICQTFGDPNFSIVRGSCFTQSYTEHVLAFLFVIDSGSGDTVRKHGQWERERERERGLWCTARIPWQEVELWMLWLCDIHLRRPGHPRMYDVD